MRVPLAKVYRAFPELDRFSDEQCETYVLLATRERQLERAGLWALNGLILAAGIPLLAALTAAVVMPRQRRGEDIFDYGIVFTLAIAVPSFTALSLRDRWLRWAIERHLRGAHCPKCRYLLLGLPVRHGSVTCPECGDVIVLAAIGVAPEDLLPPANHHSAGPSVAGSPS